MAVKLADTLAPMGDFEIAEAKDVSVMIGDTKKRLQQAIEDGDIGGAGNIVVKCTEAQYGALLPAQKALNVIYSTEKFLYYHDESIAPVVDVEAITDTIGDLEELKTEEKGSVVGAINEVSDSLVDKADKRYSAYGQTWATGVDNAEMIIDGGDSESFTPILQANHSNSNKHVLGIVQDSFRVAEYDKDNKFISQKELATMDKVGDNIIVTPHTQISSNITISASTLNRVEIDVAKSGYTCIGILSLQDNHGTITSFRSWFVEKNKVIVYVSTTMDYSDYVILASLLYKKN